MIFDTHAHYDDDRFNEDRDSLLKSMQNNSVKHIVTVSASMDDLQSKIKLLDKYDFLYAAAGVHPENVTNMTDEDIDTIRKSFANPRFVAVGEIGLDYHDDTPKELQDKWFRKQLDLAVEINKPVIIHSRDACEDTLSIIDSYPNLKAVMHCFSYTKEVAEILLKKNFYFGIGGVVTFKNARKLVEAVEVIPLNKILLETDCPYLAPEPFRGKRNDSSKIKYIIEKIAEIKNISSQEVEDTTYNNAVNFYELNR